MNAALFDHPQTSVALFDYEPLEHGEIKLNKGDLVIVYQSVQGM